MRVPTDEVVKDAATFRSGSLGEPLGVEPEAFDHWLRLIKAEAWDEGAEQAVLKIITHDQGTETYQIPLNPYREQEEA